MKRYPPVLLATCLAPWDSDYGLMEELFSRQVRNLREGLTSHLYIFGTAGEGYAVTDRQFARIATLFRQETIAVGAVGMVGLISQSLGTILERLELARDLGFREFQLSLPNWGELKDSEVDTFFDLTCGRYPDCRFLHYNLMRTKRLLAPADYRRLAARHPNLVAVKMGVTDKASFADYVTAAPELQFFPTERGFALVRDDHECGLLVSWSSTNFAGARRFHAARGAELAAMFEEVRKIGAALRTRPTPDCHMDGVFDKMLCKIHLPEFPLRLLPPYTSPSEDMFNAFREAMPLSWLPG